MARGANRKTERNAQIVALAATGLSQRQIAAQFGISQVRVGHILEDEAFRAAKHQRRARHAQP